MDWVDTSAVAEATAVSFTDGTQVPKCSASSRPGQRRHRPAPTVQAGELGPAAHQRQHGGGAGAERVAPERDGQRRRRGGRHDRPGRGHPGQRHREQPGVADRRQRQRLLRSRHRLTSNHPVSRAWSAVAVKLSSVSTTTRVFIARLAGIGVFDPNGDQLGRVRDAVATLRVGRQPPRVLGLVVEVQHRRRIFVPMGRVTRIESGGGRADHRQREHQAVRAAAERAAGARRGAGSRSSSGSRTAPGWWWWTRRWNRAGPGTG